MRPYEYGSKPKTPIQRARRTCLRCERTFLSEGVHNRLCKACVSHNEHASHEPIRGRLRGLRERGAGG